MGILDRFRTPKPPVTPRADSGRAHYGGFLEVEELNSLLVGQAGLAVFDKMFRTDPDVRRVVAMTANPIIGGTWDVQPEGGDDADAQAEKIADDLRWALGLGSYQGVAPLKPGWRAHLAEAVPVVARSGFAPFEVTWTKETRDGTDLLVPNRLGLRLPRSIHRWNLDKTGELESVEQFVPSRGDYVTIPRRDVLYYRVGSEGDNYEGVSLLRPCYKPWYLKDKIERIDAIGNEREATGLPVVFPPQAADDALLDDLELKLARVRAGEVGYLIMPGPEAASLDDGSAGWSFRVEGLGGSTGRDALKSLEYHRDAISSAFVAEFMRLGQGTQSVGARATADVQQNPFLAACEALAAVFEDEVNAVLVPRFVAINYGTDAPVPRLTMGLVDSTSLTELATFVQGLTGAGALHPDDPLEDFLRERADLPAADAKARQERQAMDQRNKEAQAKAAEQGALPPVAVDPSKVPGAKGTDKIVTTRPYKAGGQKVTEKIRHLDTLGDEDRARVRALARQIVTGRPARQLPPPPAPDVNVTVHNAPPPAYRPPRQGDIHVAAPAITVEPPDVNVTLEAPPPADVHVSVPPPPNRRIDVTYDDDGNATSYQEIPDDDS